MRSKHKLALCALLAVLPIQIVQAEAEPQLEEMVVVASRTPTEDYKVGRSLSVLNEARIKDLGYSNAADLFRVIPGIAVNRQGGFGGMTQLRLRGAEANHVVVLIDGIEVSAAGSGEFDFSSLLSADIERIEVLRGPQSGLYGSNALAGVISIHTRSPVEGFSADVSLEGGSHDTRSGSVSISGGNAQVQGRLSYINRQSEFDISENDALLGGEDDKNQNQTLSGQLRALLSANLDVSIYGRFTDKETDTDGFDFSGGPLQGLAIDDRSFSDTEDQTFGVVANLSLAEGRSISRLSLEQTDTELDGGTFGSEGEREQIRFDTTWVWSDDYQTTGFVQHEEEQFTNPYPFDPSQAPTQERDLTGYGIEQRMSFNETVFLNGTVRRDNNDDFEDETTYSVDAALLINEGRTRLRASYGRGVTNPTFFEQFGFVPGTFVGNPGLEPEKSVGWDIGVEHEFGEGEWQLDVTYFDADLENEIQSSFPSVVNADGESDRSGVEVSVDYQADPTSYLSLSYTYTDSEDPNGEEVRRPEHIASLSGGKTVLDDRLRLTASVIYNGEQRDTDFRNFFTNGFAAEMTDLDSYVLVNIGAQYQVTDAIEVYARLENLFDDDYEEVIGYATPGRTVLGGIRVRLGE